MAALGFAVLLVFLNLGSSVQAAEHFHTVRVSSLYSSGACQQPQTSTNPATLPIVHRHGPCSDKPHNSPTIEEILAEDESRVAAINGIKSSPQSDSTVLPANSGLSLINGGYVVRVGFGTPAQQVSLDFDTGSSLTWTQCLPCKQCYEQADPIFDTSKSSSYSNVSCNSHACALVASDTSVPTKCSTANTCIYGIAYGDSSISVGYLAQEKLTLTKADAVSGFMFGCAKITGGRFGLGGTFGLAAGLIGLGRGPLSFVTQTAATYERVFSYCIPSSSRYTGFLSFGGRGTASATPLQYTPMSSADSPFYEVDIVGVSVGGVDLSIPQTVFATAHAIIDSGTRISRLPPAAYAAIRDAFAAAMSIYPPAPPSIILDTCYDMSNLEVISMPKIAITFRGGAVIQLHPTGILYPAGPSKYCLGLAANKKPTQIAILGNVQQRTFEILYDETAKRIGFAPNVCK